MLFTFDWQSAAPKYIRLNGEKNAIVRTEKLDQGYLWQYRKKYGFADTLEAAKQWVETLAEFYDIPAQKRWLAPL